MMTMMEYFTCICWIITHDILRYIFDTFWSRNITHDLYRTMEYVIWLLHIEFRVMLWHGILHMMTWMLNMVIIKDKIIVVETQGLVTLKNKWLLLFATTYICIYRGWLNRLWKIWKMWNCISMLQFA